MSSATKSNPSPKRTRVAHHASATPSWHQVNIARHASQPPSPRPQLVVILKLVSAIVLALVVGLGLSVESRASLSSPGGWLQAVGRVAAFAGSYLLLVMVLLTARLPWLERTVGQDTLVRWHRKIAPYGVSLVSLHVVTIIWGYSQMLHTNVVHMLWSFWIHYPDILSSSVGFVLLLMAAFTSIRIARSQMKYETWWIVHLYTYLGLGLAFMHQIRTGVMFIGHPHTMEVWTTLWVGAAILVLLLRVGVPLVRNQQYQLRVAGVTQEAPHVYSLTVTGKNIDKMAVSGGQFFQWRFLTRELWWHSHPYSLSALPRPPYLRITVKGLGDQSSAIAHLKPGTRVFVEGPYGAFTHHATKTNGAVLIAAGVGITPIRALLEDLPKTTRVTVIVRATRPDDILHADEMKALVAARDGRYHEVVGTREQADINERTLNGLIENISSNDVFVCGPPGFTQSIVRTVTRLGVPHSHIHHETFTF